VSAGPEGTLIRLPDACGQARALQVLAVEGHDAPASSPQAIDWWNWLEVRSAVPRVVAATVERFVPQMVNLEVVGGVHFQKGCYPGQEVVARSQYRGTLKRRAFLFEVAAPADPGQDIFAASDPGQPAGTVVLAAAVPGEPARTQLLAEMKIAEAAGALHLGAANGPALRALDLPYPLPAEA
jgi:folate-binding protein YgfZ